MASIYYTVPGRFFFFFSDYSYRTVLCDNYEECCHLFVFSLRWLGAVSQNDLVYVQMFPPAVVKRIMN